MFTRYWLYILVFGLGFAMCGEARANGHPVLGGFLGCAAPFILILAAHAYLERLKRGPPPDDWIPERAGPPGRCEVCKELVDATWLITTMSEGLKTNKLVCRNCKPKVAY